MGALLQLLSPKARQIRNSPRSSERAHAGALLLFALLGIGFWLVIFFTAMWFFAKCVEVQLIGQILVRKILDMLFLTFLSVLLFSNVITAFTTFLLAEDLELLVAAPIPPDRLYHARLTETVAHSSWMVLIFGLPVLVAAGVVFEAGAGYYAVAALVLPPFLLIPAAVGTLVTLLMASSFPAQRSRDVLMLLALLGFAVLYLLFRLLNPERLLSAEGFGDMVEFLSAFQTPGSVWLPSYWATESLFPMLRGEGLDGWVHLAVLYTSAAAAVVIGTWTARPLMGKAYARGLEGRAGEGVASRVGRYFVAPLRWATRDTPDGRPSPTRELVLKDARLFFRDTAQWSQLLLIAALVVVYLVNFKNFRMLDASGFISPVGLYFMNLGLAGFVLAALAVRFVFPAISLEGRTFWVLRTAPMTMGHLLRAKYLTAIGPLLVFSTALSVLTNFVIDTPWSMSVLSTLTVALVCVGITGLGTGLGAIYPRFKVDNPARIASGLGGVIYMILSMGLVFAMLALEGYPIWLFYHSAVLGEMVVSPKKAILAGSLLAASMLLCFGAAYLPMRLGARRLERWGG